MVIFSQQEDRTGGRVDVARYRLMPVLVRYHRSPSSVNLAT
jgi:hypothetical protein